MKVKAWNNGDHNSTGSGYGIKIDKLTQDSPFNREWKTIILELEGETAPIEINIDKDSFWNKTCRELISIEIGKWLIKNQLAPWKKGNPPTLQLEQKDGQRFLLIIEK